MTGSGTDCRHMSAAQYAAHRGCSDSYVRRLRRKGLIIDCAHGQIDVEESDNSLGANLHPLRGGDRTAPAAADAAPDVIAASAQMSAAAAIAVASAVNGSSLPEAVRRERLARARLAELELGELSGQLIRKQDADRAVVTLVRHAVTNMRLMASRLRGPLAAATDPRKCESLIEDDIALICAEMQKAAARVAAGDPVVEVRAPE